MDFSRNFPRHGTIGPVLILAGMTWFLFILHGENMADFEGYHGRFTASSSPPGWEPAFLKDYLAVRASGTDDSCGQTHCRYRTLSRKRLAHFTGEHRIRESGCRHVVHRVALAHARHDRLGHRQ